MNGNTCPECGHIECENEYGILYCPSCQKGFTGNFREMVEDTEGGYY